VADPEIINGVQKGKYYGERGEPESCPMKLKKIMETAVVKLKKMGLKCSIL